MEIYKGTFTPEVIVQARLEHEQEPKYKNSGTGNTRRTDGFAVEIIAAQIFGAQRIKNPQSDLIMKNGIKVDVKTVLRRVEPRAYFEVNLPLRSFDFQQDLDVYIFADVDGEGGFTLIGWISKADYSRLAVLHEKGTYKTTLKDGTDVTWPADNLSIRVDQLRPFNRKVLERAQRMYGGEIFPLNGGK